ncbi:PQQ-dependent sugar dehydrogenase, partial [Microcella sp.]|uniref:PQQ-dependent sugar dehydrogenase n=1 Tax=Microcella sp. TaxID=1913979 RepID=UPI00299F5E9A
MVRGRCAVLVVAVAVALAGCAAPDDAVDPIDPPASTPAPELTEPPVVPLAPTGEFSTLTDGMTTPWSVIPLATGSMLISERDTARVFEVTADGERRLVGTVPGVRPGGEGGLLGIAARDTGTPYLYAYFTAARDNRIVRIEVTGAPGSYELGE